MLQYDCINVLFIDIYNSFIINYLFIDNIYIILFIL